MSRCLLDTDILSEIAAIALVHRLPVVTGNVSHFEYVGELGYELVVDNWRGG